MVLPGGGRRPQTELGWERRAWRCVLGVPFGEGVDDDEAGRALVGVGTHNCRKLLCNALSAAMVMVVAIEVEEDEAAGRYRRGGVSTRSVVTNNNKNK